MAQKPKLYKTINVGRDLTDEEQKEWERLVSLNRKAITLAEQEETLKRAKQMVAVETNQIVKFPEPFQLYGHTYDAVVQCDSGTLTFLDTKHYWTGEL